MSDRLETARLILRRFTQTDRISHRRLFATPEQTLYLKGGPIPPEQAAVRAAGLVDLFMEHWTAHRFGPWAVTDKFDGGLVGQCGLRYVGTSDEVELLYAIDRPAWGRGLATEASAVVLADGFGRLGLNRVIALAHPDNLASRRVMSKLGMTLQEPGVTLDGEPVLYVLDSANFRGLATVGEDGSVARRRA